MPTTVSFHCRDSHNSRIATFTTNQVVEGYRGKSRVGRSSCWLSRAEGTGVTVDWRLWWMDDSLDGGEEKDVKSGERDRARLTSSALA
jgi:hypothetical protein